MAAPAKVVNKTKANSTNFIKKSKEMEIKPIVKPIDNYSFAL